ncbi:MAG TPA: TonB-dependent receptor [Woeseiaceae bacterium]|nr:TonB-dependent receptor [Woeseiaceae bacterium]
MKVAIKVILLSVSAALAASDVLAQVPTLEEIVVTARKRAESLEESPVSVRAFTEAEIESAGIETPHDFIALTPNVTLVQTQNAGNSFINVRGVSQARNSEMSVAVLVDGVLMANPAEFNQQLFDIQQIEVLRGPQGALYGRNAIGGAITIVTQEPSEEMAGRIELGADSGPGYTARGTISGPLGGSETLKYRLSGSYVDTDGYIDNPLLGEEADPYKDVSARLKLLWEPTDAFSADVRLSTSALDTQALYFNIAAEADDTSLPVRVNNAGVNERDLLTFSLKLEWQGDYGSFTSITAYDQLEELLTGDQFSFLPPEESFLNLDTSGFGDFIRFLTGDAVVDLSQTQFLDTDSWSQEFRFVSPTERRFRYIFGVYGIATDRFISTGNQIDRGNGVFPVYRDPRPSVFVDPTDPSPQLGLLSDGQDNFAWAVFGEVAYDLSDAFEASFSLRYDEDTRENTTLTEPLYDSTGIGLVPGTVREETWDDLQPKLTLRYQPNDDVTLYGGYSRGFRSGGFNQSGVGEAVPEPGIEDIFDEQIADTYEVGVKAIFGGGRIFTSLSAFYTDFEGAYFFFFDPGTSTQNLGSIPETEYMGFELEGNAQFNDHLTGYFGLGYTDSEIKEAADPADVGNQAPLVSEYTLNVGGVFRYPIGIFGGNTDGVIRLDYQKIGDTWWDPGNISVRSPVDLIDVRVGLDVADNWSLMLWSKNALDEEYNSEFSPGPAPGANFLFKAPPQRWGLSFIKHF